MPLQFKHFVAIVVAFILLFWLFLRDDDHSSEGQNPGGVQVDTADGDAADLVGLKGMERESLRAGGETESDEVVAEGTVWTGPCVVKGRVVNVDGDPIEGALVRLNASKVWAEGFDVPRLPGRFSRFGFVALTDEHGGFQFSVPVPTVSSTSLEVTAGRFFDRALVRFSGKGREDALPPLGIGTRNLGDIHLERKGAIQGRVTNEAGEPLADVRIGIGPSASSGFHGMQDTWTEEDGTYVVAHAPKGTYGVGARIQGYDWEFREPVTVVLGQDTLGIDIILTDAPAIEGRVYDEWGRRLKRVEVTATSPGMEHPPAVRNYGGGSFKVALEHDSTVYLQAKLPGYEPWGNDHDPEFSFESGTYDVKIILKALVPTTFRVIDDETGEAITRFGINIHQDCGAKASESPSSFRQPPIPKEQPNGLLQTGAREGLDLYTVAAKGYPLKRGEVQRDSPDSAIQTVRLKRSVGIKGRVFREGLPLRNTPVQVVSVSSSSRDQIRGPKRYRENGRSRQTTSTDNKGRFSLSGLGPQNYRIRIVPAEGAPLVLGPWSMYAEGDIDLGDIDMPIGAHVTGTVLLPAGISPEGLHVHVDNPRRKVEVPLNKQAGFTFKDLAPGAHTFTLDGLEGLLKSGAYLTVELEPGETRQLLIDASTYNYCDVELKFEIPGLSVNRVSASISSVDDPTRFFRFNYCTRLGTVKGRVPAWGETIISLQTLDVPFEVPNVRLNLTPGADIKRDIRIELSSLSLELPEDVPLPETGEFEVLLESIGPDPIYQEIQIYIADGKLNHPKKGPVQVTDRTIKVSGLAPGDYKITFAVSRAKVVEQHGRRGKTGWDLADGKTQSFWSLSDGIKRSSDPPHYTYNGRISLSLGEECRLLLE